MPSDRERVMPLSYCARCGHPGSHHGTVGCVWRDAALRPCREFKRSTEADDG